MPSHQHAVITSSPLYLLPLTPPPHPITYKYITADPSHQFNTIIHSTCIHAPKHTHTHTDKEQDGDLETYITYIDVQTGKRYFKNKPETIKEEENKNEQYETQAKLTPPQQHDPHWSVISSYVFLETHIFAAAREAVRSGISLRTFISD